MRSAIVRASSSALRQVTSVGRAPELRTVGDEPQPQLARPHLVREVEDRLRGTEVAFEAHERGVGVSVDDLEQVPSARPAERVDRLCVVADDGEPAAVGTEPAHDVDLKLVDVLVLVDEHPVPARPQPRSDIRISDQRPPGDEQIIQVEQAAFALAVAVMPQQAGDRVGVLERPGKPLIDHGAGRRRGVDRAGGDVGDGACRGQPHLGAIEPVLCAQQVDQVDHIVGIDDRHVLQTQMLRVLGDDAVRNGMERAAGNALRSLRVTAHHRSARKHRGCRAPGERQQQDPFRYDPRLQKPRNPCGEHARLPGAGPGRDHKRPIAVLDGLQLCRIQPVERITYCHGGDGNENPGHSASSRHPKRAGGPCWNGMRSAAATAPRVDQGDGQRRSAP